ncbi:nicotinate-nucleotide pyrophosphorylase [Lentisphaera araneosa HTCC2155]|uniref:Probable nicotinate-nucleotide pyrophosphorylase [carboxylating] n=1 Tax=Lentisphaera araneosa HTCC2155 TaxID=313628 RepID=A6DHR0_9BACT|nr:carboxylating nicotinate-nucleotide diphosphorylase [Lentisphaera araneosa]EDM28564.1 nicotinate-nucleotide pyrophosphorylase [Lentisphaera araneosa HTCC2155]
MITDKLKIEIQTAVKTALFEDVGSGDATTLGCIPTDLQCTANFLAKQDCTVAGLTVAETVLKELDPKSTFEILIGDGSPCKKGDVMAIAKGNARAIITGERVALNFLQHLCAIATTTSTFVKETEGTKAEVLDTRKTTPGLRALEKYAVLCGGGTNHRFGLYDRIMIKDNHRELAAAEGSGGILRSVRSCRMAFPQIEIEVEADTLEEVQEALDAEADYILLDNMSNDEMSQAVSMTGSKCLLEASGGITIDRVAEIAKTGVDYISVGALTHSAGSIDISLEIKPGV